MGWFPRENPVEVLRRVHLTPEVSQRILAKELGITLGGGINFCFQVLVGKDRLKMQNFSRIMSKLRYAYLLTLARMVKKSKLTAKFLSRKRKAAGYEDLEVEIGALKAGVNSLKGGSR